MSEKSTEEFPLISINCNELNESLIESELFGHKKGSFTGADSDYEGKLYKANGGVLFLDEIGSISKSMQVKLLSVLENKEFSPVGSKEKIKINFSLISATCEPMEKMIDEGSFRKDLFERLKGIEIELIPFREQTIERRNKVIKNILSSFKRKLILTPDALKELCEFPWYGNIREIKHFFEKASSKGIGIIDKEYIQNDLLDFEGGESFNETDFTGLIPLFEKEGFAKSIESIEKFIIYHFYKKNDFKTRQTIKELGISNSLFYKRMKIKENS